MNVEAQLALRAICAEPSFDSTMLNGLRALGDFSAELQAEIEASAKEERWGCVCRLIWVAQRFPDRSLVPTLLDLLSNQDPDGDTCLEAIVDALVILPDERSVDALTRALSYRLAGDDLAFHFNRKVIGALEAIGSVRAIAGIRQALEDPEDQIRSFAAATLGQINEHRK